MNDQQYAQFLEIIGNSKLFSELDEQTVISDNSFFASINTGEEDAKKIKLPLLRGYSGDWNASTNTPTLVNGSGVSATIYRVGVAGTRDLGSGSVTYGLDEIVYYNGAKWVKLIQSQISDIVGLRSELDALQTGLYPQGNWNASTNTPDIDVDAETGYYWIVSVAGSTDLGGITDWEVNDWAVKTADSWAKIDNTDKITGSGTQGKYTKWGANNTLVESPILTDDGVNLILAGSVISGGLSVSSGGNINLNLDTSAQSKIGTANIANIKFTRSGNQGRISLSTTTNSTAGLAEAVVINGNHSVDFLSTISATDGIFSGDVSAVDGSFGGDVSAVDGNFSGILSALASGSIGIDVIRDIATNDNTTIRFRQLLGDGFIGVNSLGSFAFNDSSNLNATNYFEVTRSGAATFASSISATQAKLTGLSGTGTRNLQALPDGTLIAESSGTGTTYSPTTSSTTNVTSVVFVEAVVTKVGNSISVRISFTCNVTASNTNSNIAFNLPVTKITNPAGGTVGMGNLATSVGNLTPTIILLNKTSATINFVSNSTTGSSNGVVMFTYLLDNTI
jgi:hypothetical protein